MARTLAGSVSLHNRALRVRRISSRSTAHASFPCSGNSPSFKHFFPHFEADHGDSLGRSSAIRDLFNAAIDEGVSNTAELLRRVEAWNVIMDLANRGIRGATPDEIRRHLACLRKVTAAMRDDTVYRRVFHAFAGSSICAMENIVYEFGPSVLAQDTPPTPGDIWNSWLWLSAAVKVDSRLASESGLLAELFRIRARVTLSANHNGEVFVSVPALEPTALSLFESLPRAGEANWSRGSRTGLPPHDACGALERIS